MLKQFVQRVSHRFVLSILLVISSIALPLGIFHPSAKAAAFTMQTGYYMGDGTTGRTISGVGFQPDFVIVKPPTAVDTAFKTSAMPSDTAAFFSATANDTSTAAVFTSDGFTIGTAVNTSGTLYNWTAFGGSDCTSSGEFCVGTYNGDNTGVRTITTGFQPDLIINKRSTNVAGHFRTTDYPTNYSDYFNSTAADTTGIFLRDSVSNGFTVGTSDNAAGGVYYYIAFKKSSSSMNTGSYTGDGTDDRSITGAGFQPDFVIVKNTTSATAGNRRAFMMSDQQPTYSSSFVAANVADNNNSIQKLESDGFQVGSNTPNEASQSMVWMAFGGVPSDTGGSGSYTMATGSYTGTGAAWSVTGTGFRPDLVMIKGASTVYNVFRTSLMPGDSTAYLSNSTTDFTGGITTLDSDGFSLGTNAAVNSLGVVYEWQAFGNAYQPDTKTGAADFAVGAYYPTTVDDTTVKGPPFQPNLLVIRRVSSAAGIFRTSEHTGDTSGSFSSTAEGVDLIQSMSNGSFQIGTLTGVNAASSPYRWFAFKSSSNFAVGTYTGDGLNDRAVTIGFGFSPDLVWVKRALSANGVLRPATLAGDSTMYFTNITNVTNRIKSLSATGLVLGTATEVNASSDTYRYIAWKIPTGVLAGDMVDASGDTVPSPSYSMSSTGYPFLCTETSGVIGTSSQRIRVSNGTANAAWTLSIAATDGTGALWQNSGDTQQYDYNDINGNPNGCSDGGDTDSNAGGLRIELSGATVSPQSGCTSAGLSLGSAESFDESITDAITLLSASVNAETNCYWDLTDIDVLQYIPAEQPSDSYNLNLTITTTAS